MKLKILIKFLYLIALLAYAASEGEKDSKVVDSNTVAVQPALLETTLGD